MSKQISLKTKITFLETGDKYAISEHTATGFQFKPIRFERGLPSVPRTFAEVKQEFLNKHIDIEGFEHNEADDKLVELLMDGYIKDSTLAECEASIAGIKNANAGLAEKIAEQTELITTHEAKILTHETTIAEQQGTISQQKDLLQTQKDELTTINESLVKLSLELKMLKEDYNSDKIGWEKEKNAYEKTIIGLEAVTEE